jgi:hypothetical protein
MMVSAQHKTSIWIFCGVIQLYLCTGQDIHAQCVHKTTCLCERKVVRLAVSRGLWSQRNEHMGTRLIIIQLQRHEHLYIYYISSRFLKTLSPPTKSWLSLLPKKIKLTSTISLLDWILL